MSAVGLGILIPCLMFLLLFNLFDDDTKLIRRTTSPGGQMTVLYERTTAKMVPGEDINYCRYLIHQRRIFPGILRNEAKLGEEVCLRRGESFPLELQ
jgi:hypothetical protein